MHTIYSSARPTLYVASLCTQFSDTELSLALLPSAYSSIALIRWNIPHIKKCCTIQSVFVLGARVQKKKNFTYSTLLLYHFYFWNDGKHVHWDFNGIQNVANNGWMNELNRFILAWVGFFGSNLANYFFKPNLYHGLLP